jgi:predicted transcriptional regulator
MQLLESDARILSSVTEAVPHLHPLTLATAFKVTRQIATERLKEMQERGLVERMKNGQYQILPSSSYDPT